jgi:Fe-S-cluster-containing hydrogenase component 2
VSLISEFCGGCGGCIAVCGFGRISMDGGVARFADGPVAR